MENDKLIINEQEKNKNTANDYTVSLASDSVRQYLADILAIPRLSEEEQKRLFYEYRTTKDEKIKERLISSNLRLVVSIAKEFSERLKRSNVNDLLDAIQEGNQGLMVAVEKYDVTLGYKFSGYATYWIRQAIARYLIETNGSIKLPVGIVELYWKIQKHKNEIANQTGKQISAMEAALLLGVKEDRAKFVIEKASLVFESLDEFVLFDQGKTKNEFISDEDNPPEDLVLRDVTFNLLNKIMREKLTSREYFVVCCKNGIVNDVNKYPNEKTLEEVGQIMGVTRERVRQILKDAYYIIKREYINLTSDKVIQKNKKNI